MAGRVQTQPTFSFNRSRENAGALADVVRLPVELQSGLILCVSDGDRGPGDAPQQRVGWHAELHGEALRALKDLVIVNDDGAGLGVLPLLKLYLQGRKRAALSGLGSETFCPSCTTLASVTPCA